MSLRGPKMNGELLEKCVQCALVSSQGGMGRTELQDVSYSKAGDAISRSGQVWR